MEKAVDENFGQYLGSSGGFQEIDMEKRLLEILPAEVKYSKGFLAADLSRFFGGLADHWVSLFRASGSSVHFVGCNKQLFFPQELARIVVIEVNGESAVLGIDEVSQEILAQSIAANVGQGAQEVVVEYFERRLLTSLTKSWSGTEPLLCYYLSTEWAEEVEIVGGVELVLEVGGKTVNLWFGLGPRLLDDLDRAWRRNLARQPIAKGAGHFDDQIARLSIELTSLSVPPATLIDYLRAGTVIDLEQPFDDMVVISLADEPWARGRVCRSGDSLVVQVTDLSPPSTPSSDGKSRVTVELARTELDQNSLIEYRQIGAIIPFSDPVSPSVSLVINSEHVANAVLGEANGRMAIHVVPKSS